MLFTVNTVVKYTMSVRFHNVYSASVLLTPENRKSCMQKFRDMLVKQGAKLTAQQVTRKAAVLIPIHVRGDQISLLYTLRAISLKTHRGQVSFPGGMVDDSDTSLEHTALREAEEEMGIQRKDLDMWGSGGALNRRDIDIFPVVGCLRRDMPLDELVLNTSEVEEVFAVSLEQLCNPKLNGHTQFRGVYSIPTYFGGAHRIWGLTGMLTYLFLKSLLPPEAYRQQVKYVPDVQRLLAKQL